MASFRHHLRLLENERITQTAEFRRWFAGSKIVDAAGKPLVVYHGTPTHGRYSNNRHVRAEQGHDEYPRFDTFNTSLGSITDSGWLGQGTYFTPDPDYAEEFGNFIMPCYLSIKNPFVIVDDNSMSTSNRLRFLQSLQGLQGLPGKFRLDLSVPEPRVYPNQVDYRAGSSGRRDITVRYSISKGRDEYYLISGEDVNDGVGSVEGRGKTPEEAIFDFRYKYDDQFGGFLLSIIGKIGADGFTDMLKQNGYDGVVEYSAIYDPPKMKEIVAFYPRQIKSAHSRGFDPNDDSFMR